MKNSLTFPISIPNFWYTCEQIQVPDPYLKNWLLDTGSLTERLQSHCANFELTLLGQRPMQPELEEIAQFSPSASMQTAQNWQVREVILHGNGQPWVFARSILPQALCDMDLSELGNRPLGQIIFNDPKFERQPFQLLHVPAHHRFQQKLNTKSDAALWGRRSVFNYRHLQLIVAEVFLPDAPAYRQLP